MSRTANHTSPAPTKVVVLGVNLNRDPQFAAQVLETGELARAAGYEVSETLQVKRRYPDRKTFIGKGKLVELKSCLAFHQVGMLIVNHTLGDGQLLRLAQELDVEVLDYTGLILTIFAHRATTAEGKLQVELAQELYGRAKLKGAWTHLERQRGGLGATGGPGERQLELDRRMTDQRIHKLRKRLAKRSQHAILIARQRRAHMPTIALVGYANAGKSTLFARLTGTKVPVSPRLFETLDTTTRKLYLGKQCQVTLSDTVGFIRNLPHELIEAFHATLREAVLADLALLVIDAADKDAPAKLATILATLDSIGAGEVPCILIANKIDLGNNQLVADAGIWDKIIFAVEISAQVGTGMTQFRDQLHQYFSVKHTASTSIS